MLLIKEQILFYLFKTDINTLITAHANNDFPAGYFVLK